MFSTKLDLVENESSWVQKPVICLPHSFPASIGENKIIIDISTQNRKTSSISQSLFIEILIPSQAHVANFPAPASENVHLLVSNSASSEGLFFYFFIFLGLEL